MKYRFGLMGKIAVSLFISSLIIMFLGITVLYTRFRTEAMRMNQLLQEANLEIAGENILALKLCLRPTLLLLWVLYHTNKNRI